VLPGPQRGVEGLSAFAARVVAALGRSLAAVQVTAEPNLAGIPAAADGDLPRLREGRRPARRRGKQDTGATAAIGFAVAPEVDPSASGFWQDVHDLGGTDFAAAVDYAGTDLYPDAFGPPAGPDGLPGAVDWVLRAFRQRDLPAAGIDASVPVRICENGWPTGPGRSEEQQARVLETIVRSASGLRAELNVTHWQLFTLRDASSCRG
jgi:hypothetical protein